jgi:hypothetical protein
LECRSSTTSCRPKLSSSSLSGATSSRSFMDNCSNVVARTLKSLCTCTCTKEKNKWLTDLPLQTERSLALCDERSIATHRRFFWIPSGTFSWCPSLLFFCMRSTFWDRSLDQRQRPRPHQMN